MDEAERGGERQQPQQQRDMRWTRPERKESPLVQPPRLLMPRQLLLHLPPLLLLPLLLRLPPFLTDRLLSVRLPLLGPLRSRSRMRFSVEAARAPVSTSLLSAACTRAEAEEA